MNHQTAYKDNLFDDMVVGGRATAEELNEVINSTGRLIEVLEIDYRKNVMAGMRWTNEWVSEAELPNREFLFLIEK